MSQENFTADPQDVQANKVMAILAYFGIFVKFVDRKSVV